MKNEETKKNKLQLEKYKKIEEQYKILQNEIKIEHDKFKSLVSNIPGVIYRCRCDENWTMEFISDNIAELTGYPASDFLQNNKRSYASVIHPDDRNHVDKVVNEGVTNKVAYVIDYRIMHCNGDIRWVYEKGQGVFNKSGELLWLDGAIFDNTERKIAQDEIKKAKEIAEETNARLEEALAKIKTLSGLLPICASCKKIRDDKGYWHQVESYIQDYSDALFSHSLCPDCIKKIYGKMADRIVIDDYPDE